jgi:hypothetical protein
MKKEKETRKNFKKPRPFQFGIEKAHVARDTGV